MQKPLIFVTILFISCPMMGQDFGWTVRTHGGDEYINYALGRLSADSLFLERPSGLSEFVLLDSIAALSRERRSAILPATIIGGVGGGVFGYTVKPVARDQEQANLYSAVFGLLVGGVAGYLVGSLVQPDELIEFHDTNRDSKAQALQELVARK